jgi:hypothetical protein
MAGMRQLVRLTTNTYQRPVPPALESLRPAAETCEHCHSKQNTQEDRLKVLRHYDSDEQSTEKVSVLFMRVGTKIHKTHLEKDIEFMWTGPDRQAIASVTSGGKTYSVKGAAASGTSRKMDCTDCHNRTGHDFETPEAAVDRVLANGTLDRARPFARRDALAALKAASVADKQSPAVQKIYSDNRFPAMMISWGTYPNNSGHERFPGCFRCHDGEHVTPAGDSITQDCATCHELVAVEEKDPKILKDLGL